MAIVVKPSYFAQSGIPPNHQPELTLDTNTTINCYCKMRQILVKSILDAPFSKILFLFILLSYS